jgi:surface polysaccharide O-acyltransferase-like enzyme
MDRNQRRYDIDWLRILAVLLLFDFHSARVFDEGGFYVKAAEVSMAAEYFVGLVNQWHMHLFMLLSGVGTYFALGKRTGREYAWERIKRLFVPFLFGTFVIIPPQVYCRMLSQDGFTGNYLDFYPHFFKGVAPEGNFEWGHLWFLLYLFVFSMLALKLFLYLRTDEGVDAIKKIARMVERPGGLFLLALPVALSEGILRTGYPDGAQNLYNDWANFFTYLIIFIYGFLIFSDDRFQAAIDRLWKFSLLLAFLFTAGLIVLINIWEWPEGYSAGAMGFHFIRGITTWCWLISFLGAGKAFLDFGGPVLKYAAEAALPMYVLHQTAIVAIAYHVIKWSSGPFVKFIVIDLAAFVLSLFIYDVLIRRINVIRVLFGMRMKKTVPAKENNRK